MTTLVETINNLNNNKTNTLLCCIDRQPKYGAEVSYKDNNYGLLSRDNELRIMGDFYFGEETASDYIDSERCIHFQFEDLINFKEFINEALLNNFNIEFIVEGKNVIWRNFSQL